MVMTASSYRSPPGTTVGVAGRRDSRTSSLTHVALAQVREENISLTTILSHNQKMVGRHNPKKKRAPQQKKKRTRNKRVATTLRV